MAATVWPQVWDRYRRVGRLARAVIALGLLEEQDGVIHMIGKTVAATQVFVD